MSLMQVKLNDTRFAVDPCLRFADFWYRVSSGDWEAHTFNVFDRFLQPDRSYLDLGAWIGPTVLYGAHQASMVHAIEPDPIAFAVLERNLRLNPELQSRVVLYEQCIASEIGTTKLYVGGFYQNETSTLGDSMSSLMKTSAHTYQEYVQVQATTLQSFVEQNQIDDYNFIKMDIEGGEFDLLSTIEEHLNYAQPTLYVSFHAPPLDLRERCFRESFEILHTTYPHVYDCNGRQISLITMADAVGDWSDETPGSLWCALERLVGKGIVASFERW